MSSFAFHPEAVLDLNEIWEYIAADNLAAADRVIAEIREAIQGLANFRKWAIGVRPDLTSYSVPYGAELFGCLYAGREAAGGAGAAARAAKSASDWGRLAR